MAFAAIQNQIPWQAWLLMAINWCWVMIYDTCYAMSDREDDLKIGVKSTAILFGKADRLIIGILQLLMLVLLCVFAHQSQFTTIFTISITIVTGLFSYQQWLIKDRARLPCFQAFLHNNWVGLTIFTGLILSYLP
jgi:4-hydroxybenzoate polyprenyltransferase